MKTIKKYNQFINESIYKEIDLLPIKDEKYQFLLNICKKCSHEYGTSNFFVKDLIEIGTSGNHKLYLNYLRVNDYEDKLSYWVVYNEHPDDLYGTDWDSGVIWEEDDKLKFSEKHDFNLFPYFMDIIYNNIKSYPDLDKWCEEQKEITKKHRYYHMYAIKSGDYRIEKRGKKPKELTWEERIDWVKNKIEYDKLLYRRKKTYDQKTLDEMLKLGEEEYNKKQERTNKIMMDILKDEDEQNLDEQKVNESIPDRYKDKGFDKVGVKKRAPKGSKHKWEVLAKKGDKYKIVKGGYRGMEDYSQHKDDERRKAFWDRMGGKDSKKANDPFSALYWHKKFGTW